jgi:serine/threonine-protein phosphatase 4 regulatory subunit 4
MATEVIYKICQNIPTELIEIFMLEKALQLVYDSEINVKTAGISLIFDIIPYLSQEEQKNRIVKIFTELVSSTTEEVIQVMSGVIGKALQHLQHFILKNQSYM